MDKALRQKALDRDKVCQNCGRDDNLQVHHLQEIINGKSIDAYQDETLDNLITLCDDCHRRLHSKSMMKSFETRNRILSKLGGKKSSCPMHRWQRIKDKTVCVRCGEVK